MIEPDLIGLTSFKICASISALTPMQTKRDVEMALEQRADFVEIRLDYAPRSEIFNIVKTIEVHKSRSVLTLRSKDQGGRFTGSEDERVLTIKDLIAYDPMLFDVELDTLISNDNFADFIEHSRAKILVSWHDFEKTPPIEELSNKLTKMRIYSNFVKIVTMAKSVEDSLRLLELYQSIANLKAIIFAMGEAGILSRVLCTVIGDAPFTYASLEEPTAPGQLSIAQMKRLYSPLIKKQNGVVETLHE